ncbi:TPA: DNA polymerase III subunit beta [Candidatus Sumerlaeota bacterium]|jgi:DNA polymerase III subunit beta|nr:DNA polymerase III subunit beta [Candidatus Sumerlaeota bacterium]
MKLRFDKNSLVFATSVTHGVANPQSSLPILGNILIDATGDGKVIFEASDMESCVRCMVDAEIIEPGSITVDAKRIHPIAQSFPDGDVELDFSGTQARISGGGKDYNLTTQSAEDFPSWPDLQASTTLELEQTTFKRILNHVLFALPQRDPRKVLLGSLFDVKDNELICVATDGKKLGLSRTTLPVIEGIHPTQAIVPGKILHEVQRNLKSEGTLRVLLGERQVAFDLGNIIYLSNRIDGMFPNYEMVIPAEFTKEIGIPRAEFTREIHRASLISEERNNSIIMRFSPGKVEFTARTYEVGSFQGTLPVVYDAEPFDIAFNHVYLNETLRVIEGENVKMKVKQNTAPVVFVMDECPESLFLVMPIKLTDIAEYQTEE